MRILNLRSVNYRGISEIDIPISPTGITLIEGANEVGKTSLAEAVRMIFEYPASSGRKEVKAIKPVHVDAGPEIEVNVQSGSWTFFYRKRFLIKPETLLRIEQPRSENLTGRDAHERALAILRETIDVDLWKALSVYQGEEIRQADFSKQRALSAALDRVAGGPITRPEDETLFERVTAEYQRYFTPSGSEGRELQKARDRRKRKGDEVAALQQCLKELQVDADRAAVLREEERKVRGFRDELETQLSNHRESLNEISDLETQVRERMSAFEASKVTERFEEREIKERRRLVDAVKATRGEFNKLTGRLDSLQPKLDEVKIELEKWKAAAGEAQTRQKDAQSNYRLHSDDLDYLQNELFLEQMLERKARIDEARKNAAEAEEDLSSNHVDDSAMVRIEAAEMRLITDNARLQAGSPSLAIRALGSIHFSIDDQDIDLQENEMMEQPVPDDATVVFPAIAEVTIKAGTSLANLSADVEKSVEKLTSACEAAGVSAPDEAKQAHEEYRHAQRVIARLAEVEKQDLRDLTYEDLERKVYGLERSVPQYLTKRAKEPPLIKDFKLARNAKDEAGKSLERADDTLEEAQRELELVREAHQQARDEHQRLRIEVKQAAKSLSDAERDLASARNADSDEELKARHLTATNEVRTAQEGYETATGTLGDKDPDKVRTLAEANEGSLRTLKNRLQSLQTELTDVRARLKAQGEEGLHERSHAAQSTFGHMQKEEQALSRRAGSARLLFETMQKERDATRRAYVEPLKDRIEHLGRLVFDNTLQIGINDDLAIVNRTLGGVTVDFNELSGGTREQLALISRLACALIVGGDGGVPVIFDDALGYTDPERLKLMGAVLSKAAKECQIIVLTCYPQRYAHVGDAKIVRL